jgi:hypothetical protein
LKKNVNEIKEILKNFILIKESNEKLKDFEFFKDIKKDYYSKLNEIEYFYVFCFYTKSE